MTTPTLADLTRAFIATSDAILRDQPGASEWDCSVVGLRTVLDALKPVVAEVYIRGAGCDPAHASRFRVAEANKYASRIIANLKGESRE